MEAVVQDAVSSFKKLSASRSVNGRHRHTRQGGSNAEADLHVDDRVKAVLSSLSKFSGDTRDFLARKDELIAFANEQGYADVLRIFATYEIVRPIFYASVSDGAGLSCTRLYYLLC